MRYEELGSEDLFVKEVIEREDSNEKKGKEVQCYDKNENQEEKSHSNGSDAAVDLCRPEDEEDELKDKGDITAYSSMLLSPFEELLCAAILSRPISHKLGLHTIRTILNPPYEFKTPEAIKEAGKVRIHQALWDAKVQHKGNIARDIGVILEAVNDNDWSNDLHNLREKCKENVEEEQEVLRSRVKGLGKIGLDIFYRHIQWFWEEAYPFVDRRTEGPLMKLGLPSDAEELSGLIDKHWTDIVTVGKGENEEHEKKRKAFVLVLERVIGADFERNLHQILEGATGTT